MTTSLISNHLAEWPTLEGKQEPLHLLADEGDLTEANRACTLAERVGKRQLPWQMDTLHGVLALKPDGQFTHPTAIIIACRQNGKTLSAAELRILYGAYDRHETVVYSAQRWLTAKAIYLRMKRLIGSRPSLKRRTDGWLCSQGVAGFTVHHDDGTESVVMFITRSADFRGPDEIDLVIYDEAYNLTDGAMAAISPTQLASKNPQTIYLSSAVNEEIHPNGDVLARLRSRALDAIKLGKKLLGMYYAEYAAPVPPSGITEAERRRIREDPETWKAANASYGVIHSEAKVRKLLIELSSTGFEVECLGWGRWPSVAEDREHVISPKDWQDMAVTSPKLIGSRAIAVDKAKAGGPWAVAAVQRVDDGRRHGEIGPLTQATTAEMVTYLVAKVTEWNPVDLVIDARSDAMVLVPFLIEEGIEPTITNWSDMARACRDWLAGALEGQFTHSDQSIFNDAVASVGKRDMPGGGFAWDKVGEAPIAPVVAISLADWALLRTGKPRRKTASPRSGAHVTEPRYDAASPNHLDAMSAAF
jgi:hypothetical protein